MATYTSSTAATINLPHAYTSTNGLSSIYGNIQSGGSPIGPTTISNSGTYTLNNVSYGYNNDGSISYGENSNINNAGYWNAASIPSNVANGNVVLTTNGTSTITLNNNYYNNYTTYVGSGTGTTFEYKKQMLFDNSELSIDEEGKVMIAGKIEMNPTKVGAALLKALQSYRKDPVEDVKDFFEKD